MRTLSTDIEIRFQQEMRLRRYSPVSIRVYTFALRAWLAWLGELDPRAATSETMRAYLLTLADTGSSEAWLGQTVSALKVLYVSKEGFESVFGPLQAMISEYSQWRSSGLSRGSAAECLDWCSSGFLATQGTGPACLGRSCAACE